MVVVVGKPETAESVRELNFRGEFEVCEIVERSIPAIQRQLEQNGEQISHLVYDVRIIGNIDQSLGLLERICVTVPGINRGDRGVIHRQRFHAGHPDAGSCGADCL